jgi:hypothetical protein
MLSNAKTKTIHSFRLKSPSANAAYLAFLPTFSFQSFYDSCSNSNPQDAFDCFYALASHLLNSFFPLKNVTLTSRDPSFFTPEIKYLLREKNKLMRSNQIEKANALSTKISKLINKSASRQLSNLGITTESKQLWQAVKGLTGKDIPSSSCPTINVELLNDHYANISTDSLYIPPCPKSSCLPSSAVSVSDYFIFKKLDTLKPTAAGLDLLPAWFLRLSAPFFARPIADLFNLSLSSSTVPLQWKSSIIHPINKTPSPAEPADYRPISITPILSRIAERFIVSNFFYPLFLSPPAPLKLSNQFAFRPTGSTTSALIYLFHRILHMLTTNPYVRVIVLDFSKAFDRVRHATLFDKFSTLGLPDHLFNWLADFYADRCHCTNFHNDRSNFKPITASVIQGSAIGPASFLTVSADLQPLSPLNDFMKYADDSYLLIPSSNIDSTPSELANIDNWSSCNNLSLNRAKSHELIFRLPRSKLPNSSLPPPIPGISRVSTLKCLGVTLTSSFSFTEHISNLLQSCGANIFALKVLRTHGLSSPLIHQVFYATTISKLTYASPFWKGFLTASDLSRMESFVSKAVKANLTSSSLSLTQIFDASDSKLFQAIISNPSHVLYQLLPAKSTHHHNHRHRAHNFSLPDKHSAFHNSNFIIRMLYSNAY